jgi:hypothetical protein
MRLQIATFLLAVIMSSSAYSDGAAYTCSATVAYWGGANAESSSRRIECTDEEIHRYCREKNVSVKIVDGYLFFDGWEPERLSDTKSGVFYVSPHLGQKPDEFGVLRYYRSYVLRIHDDETASIVVRWLDMNRTPDYVYDDRTFMACKKQ